MQVARLGCPDCTEAFEWVGFGHRVAGCGSPDTSFDRM